MSNINKRALPLLFTLLKHTNFVLVIFIFVQDKKDPSQQPENVALLGWCVPASCTPSDLQNYLNRYLDKIDFPLKKKNVTYVSHVDESTCQRQEEKSDFDHVDISFW